MKRLILLLMMLFPVFALNAQMVETAQLLGTANSTGVDLGDLDGDGDLDAFVCNDGAPNKVWFNDGSGSFTAGVDIGASLTSQRVNLGDLDGDGDLDAFIVTSSVTEGAEVYFNNGSGVFTVSAQAAFAIQAYYGLRLADTDGDGDLDAILGGLQTNGDAIWLNDGSGNFGTPTVLSGGATAQRSYAFGYGDFDGDSDNDIYAGRYNLNSSWVYFGDGAGNYTAAGVAAPDGNKKTRDMEMGDLDGDGDLDGFMAYESSTTGSQTVVNDGSGGFSIGQTFISGTASTGVELFDVDGDGDLDAFLSKAWSSTQPNELWLNNGSGIFSNAGMTSTSDQYNDCAAGDLDGDGDDDVFVVGHIVQPFAPPGSGANRVYLNEFCDVETCTGATLTFAPSSPQAGDAYAWDFGDGNNSTAQNPTHSYAATGTFTVSLTITDANTCVNTEIQKVCVYAPPSITAMNPVDPTCNGGSDGSVSPTYGGGAAGSTFTYAWTPGSQTSASITGQSAGTYTVIVTDPVSGCTATDNATLTDPALIDATFTITK